MIATYSVCVKLIVCLTLLVGADADCHCRHFHPQEMICRRPFVGEILITNEGLSTNETIDDQTKVVAAKIRINKIYKGGYEDFDEGSEVFLYTPATIKGCKNMELEAGEHLIAAKLFRDGLLMDSCDFQVRMDWFASEEQPRAIHQNIRSKSYVNGCQHCRIKRPKEKSFVYHDECREKCEFPVSTAACVPTGEDGRCEWNRVAHDAPVTTEDPAKEVTEDPAPVTPTGKAEGALGHEKPPVEGTKTTQNKKIGDEPKDGEVVINTITYPFTFRPTQDIKDSIVTHIMRVLWPTRKQKWS